MNAPKCITDLIPHAYSWENPRFAFYERGLLVYITRAHSNAGGSEHYVYFPVEPGNRTLKAYEDWGTLADDATRAVENGTAREAMD